jgi:hypothetical protein
MAQMTVLVKAALNWNVLSSPSDEEVKLESQLRTSARPRELGGRIVALTMPELADMSASFLTYCALWLIPGWEDLFTLDVPGRI